MINFEDDIMPSRFCRFPMAAQNSPRLSLIAGRTGSPSIGHLPVPMRLDEISYPYRNWKTHKIIAKDYTVYLYAVPSSWGVAYFGNQWKAFLSFVEARWTSSFYSVNEEKMNLTGYAWNTKQGDPNLWLSDSRTNTWVASSKRFMVDFDYGRGAYTSIPT